MNILDILVIVTIGLCILIGAARGFIKTVMTFLSFIIAIFLTNWIYPYVGRFLRGIDGLFNSLQRAVAQAIGLDNAIAEAGGAAEAEIINSLPLPQSFQNAIIENNTVSTHIAIGAETFADYISGFIASIIINIIAIIVVFALIFTILHIITRVLNIVSKLPVINSLNKFLGAIVGGIWGLVLTWIILAMATIFFSAQGSFDIYESLANSHIARPLNEVNFALEFILRLFP